MKKNVLIGAIALLGMSSTFAGSYVKAEVQKSYNDVASDICDYGWQSCTDTPMGFRFAYGYSFNDYIALELGYGKTGEFKAKDASDSLSVELKNFDVAAIARLPVSDVFAFTGKLGLNRAEATTKLYDSYWNYAVSYDENSVVLVYGLGFEIAWFTMGYEVINDAEIGFGFADAEEDDFERLYAGVKFSF